MQAYVAVNPAHHIRNLTLLSSTTTHLNIDSLLRRRLLLLQSLFPLGNLLIERVVVALGQNLGGDLLGLLCWPVLRLGWCLDGLGLGLKRLPLLADVGLLSLSLLAILDDLRLLQPELISLVDGKRVKFLIWWAGFTAT